VVAISLFGLQHSAFGQTTAQLTNSPGEASGKNERHVYPHGVELLRQFNASLVSLTKEVAPAVVQIMVTSYGPVDSSGHKGDVASFARQRDIGSGVIVDSNGYILTNEHVIDGAQRIRVLLALPDGAGSDPTAAPVRRILEAKLVGADKDIDLALLKVDAHDLPVVTLSTTRPVYTGELVLAVGSPEGLQGSVTMGVVSSVSREPHPDMPAAYIQTDAPINPGNSGGPLIDMDGFVVGLNTLILSESGGSEGLGFAIPARTVQFVYENLRKYGRVNRTEIQATAQEITPTLAEGLGLSQNWGIIISDVAPDGPAAAAGLKAGDIVLSVDHHRVTGLPDFMGELYLHSPDAPVQLDVLRDSKKVSLAVPALQHHDSPDGLANHIDPHNLIGRLGVFVSDLDDNVRNLLPDNVRNASGVVVVAQSPELNSYTSSLRAGDILHTINRTQIESVNQLRSTLRGLGNGRSVVLQIEREGKLQYVAFEWGD
jgi:serine protease Do